MANTAATAAREIQTQGGLAGRARGRTSSSERHERRLRRRILPRRRLDGRIARFGNRLPCSGRRLHGRSPSRWGRGARFRRFGRDRRAGNSVIKQVGAAVGAGRLRTCGVFSNCERMCTATAGNAIVHEAPRTRWRGRRVVVCAGSATPSVPGKSRSGVRRAAPLRPRFVRRSPYPMLGAEACATTWIAPGWDCQRLR